MNRNYSFERTLKVYLITSTTLFLAVLFAYITFLVYMEMEDYFTWRYFWLIFFGSFCLPAIFGLFGMISVWGQITSPTKKVYRAGAPPLIKTGNKRFGKTLTNQFQSAVPIAVKGLAAMPGVNNKMQTILDPINYFNVGGFLFYEPGMLEPVIERDLYDFCLKAWRRYRHAVNGDMSINKVYSGNFFMYKLRPKIPYPQYMSIMHVLTTCGVTHGDRRQGKSGYPKYPPNTTIIQCKYVWNMPLEDRIELIESQMIMLEM